MDTPALLQRLVDAAAAIVSSLTTIHWLENADILLDQFKTKYEKTSCSE